MVWYTDEDHALLNEIGYDTLNEKWTQAQIIDLQTAAEQVVDQWEDDWDDVIYRNDAPPLSDEFKAVVAKAKLFFEIVDGYLSTRYSIDSQWGVDECDGLSSIDLYDDEITLQWTEYDSCRGEDYYHRDFPVEHLWTSDWKAAIEAEVEEKRKAAEAKRKAAEEQRKQVARERDLKRLRELIAQYPEAAKNELGARDRGRCIT